MAKITLRDIARESGYSLGSVSRALNNAPGVSAEAREAILAIAQKHHYQLNPNAKYLKQKASSGILILIKGEDPRRWLMARLIEKKANQAGYEAEIKNVDEKDNEVSIALAYCGIRNLQGILFLGSKLSHFIDNFSKIRVPCVLIGQDSEELGFSNLSSICFDEAASAQFAMEALLNCGAKNIVVLGEKLEESQIAKNRFQGIQFACYARGLHFDAKNYLAAPLDAKGGYACMEKIAAERQGKKDNDTDFPDAILAFSLESAAGIMRWCADHNLKVGEDLSLIAIDAGELSQYLIPRLSCIVPDYRQMANQAFELLQSMIEEKAGARHLTSPCKEFRGESLHSS